MRVFILTYTFPPMVAPRAVQIARLLPHLPDDLHVICGQGVYAEDPDLYPDYKKQTESIHRLTMSAPELFWRKIARRLFSQRFNQPDFYTRWAQRAALHCLNVHSPDPNNDILLTFGAPMSVHLGGLKIKRASGLKWVALFSDPWVDNPFNRYNTASRLKNQWYEQQVLSQADYLFFNTERARKLVTAKYPGVVAAKAGILPHTFDATLFTGNHVRQDKMILRYVGNFYGHRSPEPLFKALDKLRETNPDVLQSIQVEIIGSLPHHMLETPAFKKLPAGLVKISPPVGYRPSLTLMSTADVLLVIDAPASESVFLPSKLIDYIGARRPIFGITPAGASADLLEEMAMPVCNTEDINSIVDNLLALHEQWRNDKLNLQPPAHIAARFEPKTVAQILENAMKAVITERQHSRQTKQKVS